MSIISFFKLKLNRKKRLFIGLDTGGDKPVVLLIHGIAATHHTWKHVVPKIDKNKYRVVAINLLGFGRSPSPRFCRYGTDDHVLYLKNTIKSLKINRPMIVVAHSMGTLIATRFSSIYPKFVKKLILVSPPVVLKDDDIRLADNKRAQAKNHSWKMLGEYLASMKRFSIRTSAFIRKIWREDGAEVVKKNWRSFNRSLRNTIINQTFAFDIAQLKMPVFIIYGLLDKMILQYNLEVIAKENNIKPIHVTIAHHAINEAMAEAINKVINT